MSKQFRIRYIPTQPQMQLMANQHPNWDDRIDVRETGVIMKYNEMMSHEYYELRGPVALDIWNWSVQTFGQNRIQPGLTGDPALVITITDSEMANFKLRWV